ncbi:glycosyltransferase family 2 protein [bacterium]|jgi:glycosyltransferase involved in cell wall biosynthesis|nr:glycosyltransferase family 2 protein [bacterium]
MNRPKVSVTIITRNEESNLPRVIKSVDWADEILVVDSGSTDGTVALARKLGARVLENVWSGYGQQKNFAQKNATYDWILNLDADEELTSDSRQEILTELESVGTDTKGFSFPRKSFYQGKWIRHGGWYPNYLVRLTDRRFSGWTEPFVHEQLAVKGLVKKLNHPIYHHTLNGVEEQVLTNLRFSQLGARDQLRRGKKPSLFRLIFKPIGKFVETYFLKRGLLDGLPGFVIAVNAAYSMFLKQAFLFERSTNENSDRR